MEPVTAGIERLAEDLAELARRINRREEGIKGSRRKVLEDYAAQGKDLLSARKAAGHGNWLQWLAQNCPGVNERRARRYIAWAKSDVTSDLSDLDAAEEAWQRIQGNEPRQPTPYSDMMDAFVSRLQGTIAGQLKELGDVHKAVAEADKWDWVQFREITLPRLAATLKELTEAFKVIEDAATQQG
jgi:hypothetical protein